MPIATITVQKKWLPTGKKRWVLETPDGIMYGANADIAGGFNQGGTYQVVFKIDEWNNKKYNVIEEIISGANGSAPSPAPQQRSASPAPSAPAGQTRDETGVDIAVLAIAKEWAKDIKVGDEAALVHAFRVIRRAWLKSKRPDTQIETGNHPIDDDIPY